ncbi:MAG: DUF4352 domain-containing protein, partial [Chloroflexota bacterium]|nr:DUF4352 domain-containing protein [Chloroflexota bacterium]
QPQRSAPPGNTRRIRLNEPVRVKGLELTVLDARWWQGTKSQHPPSGYVYVGYKLRVAALAKQQRIVATRFRVSADGREEGTFAFVRENRAWQPFLSFANLRRGEAVTGWLSFQVRRPNRFVSLTHNADEFDTYPDIQLDIPCCPVAG